jgi:glutathione synthase/RimK-type ligase-like ATP-grasp enzyme
LALQLSAAIGVDVSAEPRQFNYLLHVDDLSRADGIRTFIPTEAIRLASDKRLLASVFAAHGVPTPETHMMDSFDEARRLVGQRTDREWCLKYPTGCGASGHRMVSAQDCEPRNWPRPFVVQEFIRMNRPEVYRTYGAGGEMFGWVVRRFPEGARSSEWVAHARGARYVALSDPPSTALDAARRALVATDLLDSFGCVDLLHRPTGDWVVLEVGTDGLFNHVDRDIGDRTLEDEILRRIHAAFWQGAEGSKKAMGSRL